MTDGIFTHKNTSWWDITDQADTPAMPFQFGAKSKSDQTTDDIKQFIAQAEQSGKLSKEEAEKAAQLVDDIEEKKTQHDSAGIQADHKILAELHKKALPRPEVTAVSPFNPHMSLLAMLDETDNGTIKKPDQSQLSAVAENLKLALQSHDTESVKTAKAQLLRMLDESNPGMFSYSADLFNVEA